MHTSSFSRFSWVTAIFLMTISLAATAHASSELVTNGDFEAGTLAGWTLTGGDGTHSGITANLGVNGSYCFYNSELAPATALTLSQTLTTTPGQFYLFSFDVKPDFDPRIPANHLEATWDGNTIFSFTNDPGTLYTHSVFGVTATGTSTEIAFTGYNTPDFTFVDNISVLNPAVVVPEASTLALALPVLALAGVGLARRKRG